LQGESATKQLAMNQPGAIRAAINRTAALIQKTGKPRHCHRLKLQVYPEGMFEFSRE
jgi:hypothetical protein